MLSLDRTLIVATASPNRRAILTDAGLEFETAVPDTDESVRDGESPEKYVRRLAEAKALSILARDIGTAVYFMLRRKEVFDMNKFLGAGNASSSYNRTDHGETFIKAAKTNCIEECEPVVSKAIIPESLAVD